jgi:hypothetical protein
MAKRKNYIVSKNPGGVVEITPMRTWIRQNPQLMPTGMDHVSHAHRLKRAFRKKGWEIKELDDRILIILPDENADVSFADELLENEVIDDEEDDELAEAAEITFGLERDYSQLYALIFLNSSQA